MNRGGWWATVHGVAESDMLEQGACSGLPPPLANPSLDSWERASISGRKKCKRTHRCSPCSNKQLCLFLTASCRLIGAHYNMQKPSLLSASGQTLQDVSLSGEVLFVVGRGRVSLKAKVGYYSLSLSRSRNIPIEKEDQGFLQPLLRIDTVNSFCFDVRASTK